MHFGHLQCRAQALRRIPGRLRRGDYTKARALHDRLMPVHDALFCEASPAPTKYAASLLGLCDAEARLPIVPLTDTGARPCVRPWLQPAS
jgi:4-hydroxy-tetrahydrodipicolinate synthase